MKNFYQILGVPIDATNEEIRTAYRKLATKFHPDKNFGDKYFEDRFKEIQLAYDTLSNQYLRSEYNQKLFDFFQRATSTNKEQSYSSATQNPQTSKAKNPKENKKIKKSILINIKEFFSSKSNIFWIIILVLPIVAYFVNSWLGVISILGIYFCILIFLGTLGDKQKSLGGCLIGFIGAPILVIYIIVQTFNFFFEDKSAVTDLANTKSVDSTTAEIDSIATVIPTDYSNLDSIASVVDNQKPITYKSLENGNSPLTKCFGSGLFGGQAYIVFKNSNETDAIVCLVNYSTRKTVRNEYIKAGTDYKMRKIPTGTYFLKVYYGNDWSSEKINFCGSKGGFNFDESFSKSDGIGDLIKIENTSTSYTTGTITLYKVSNGNMNSEQINESEFFR